uniref:Uncharacterized protein n=1 Tax=Arundo donax TaxID=35708 RepID=A0A0A9BBT9_ARUDO
MPPPPGQRTGAAARPPSPPANLTSDPATHASYLYR